MTEYRTEYRTVLPPVDAQFYGATGTYVAIEEALDKIREVAFAYRNQDGTINVVFEADDEYELAITVKDLEHELNAAAYWESILIIERPTPIVTKLPHKRAG